MDPRIAMAVRRWKKPAPAPQPRMSWSAQVSEWVQAIPDAVLAIPGIPLSGSALYVKKRRSDEKVRDLTLLRVKESGALEPRERPAPPVLRVEDHKPVSPLHTGHTVNVRTGSLGGTHTTMGNRELAELMHRERRRAA